MKPYDFEFQKEVWEKIPFAGRQMKSKVILTWSADRIKSWIEANYGAVYAQESHRGGKYKRAFYEKVSIPEFKHVYDFGCGGGFFALELCRCNYQVSLADINENNLRIADTVLQAFGFKSVSTNLITAGGKDFASSGCDIFHSVGVLHHTPYIREILQRAVGYLNPGGQIWLMLYSDQLFKKLTKSEPGPIDRSVTEHPNYHSYITHDPRGCYVDWYNREKLEFRVGDFLDIVHFEYVGLDDKHIVVKLEPK